jgi:hypothetical protein
MLYDEGGDFTLADRGAAGAEFYATVHAAGARMIDTLYETLTYTELI